MKEGEKIGTVERRSKILQTECLKFLLVGACEKKLSDFFQTDKQTHRSYKLNLSFILYLNLNA